MTTRRWLAVVVALAAIAAMGWSIQNGFVYDDVAAIPLNARVTDPSLWHTIPFAPYWLGTLWRPLTVAIFALEWWSGHGAPWVFHLVSIAGYIGVSLALFSLVRRLGTTDTIAAVVAVLFAVHPAHVEVVANVVGQGELWTSLALLACCRVYVDARLHNREPRLLFAIMVLVALGIVGKEQGFMAPIVLIGAELLLVRDRKRTVGDRLRLIVPAVAVAVVLFGLRGAILNDFAGDAPARAFQGIGIAGRATTLLAVVPEYVRLLVWPIHLQADYGPPGIPIGGPFTLLHIAGLVLVVILLDLLLWSWRRAPVIAFGLWWALVTIAPVTNVFTVSGLVMAERVLFLPSIGVMIAVGGAIQYALGHGLFASRQRRVIAASIAVAWIATMTVRSALRVPTWSTQERFYSDITADGPGAYRAFKVAGDYLEQVHRRSEAIASYRESIALWPHDYEVYDHLGQVLRRDGRCDAAVPVLIQGIHVDSTASGTRAKLIECLAVTAQWDAALAYADSGVAIGQGEFRQERERVEKLERREVEKP